MTVILYTEQQFSDVTRAPEWAGASFDGKIRVPVRGALERPGELERVLAHEFTHALVWSLAPRVVPTWLNEGLAVLFEGQNLDWATRRLHSAPQRFALSDLHRSFSQLNAEQAAVAYAESPLAAQASSESRRPHGGASHRTRRRDGVRRCIPAIRARTSRRFPKRTGRSIKELAAE